jgi:hypothetical protein
MAANAINHPGAKKKSATPGGRAACIPVARQSARTRRLISVEKQNIVPDVDAVVA